MRFSVVILGLWTAAAFAQPQIPQPPPVRPVGPGGPPAFPGTMGTPPVASDKLPDGVRLRLGSSKFREANYVSAASLSPDGKVLAVCGGQPVIRFLDVATGKELRRFGIRENLQTNQLFWSPDGARIVTSGYQGINVWDARDGKLVKQAASGNPNGRNGMIHVSDDGKFVAIGHQYEVGNVRVIDLTAGGQVSSVKPEQNAGVFGALSPKGETLATWGQHYNRGNAKQEDVTRIARTVQLWDAQDGKEKAALVSDIPQITAVRFSPDGVKVAAGGNGVVQLWDVATGKLERRFAGRSGQGAQLAFSADGRTLSAAGQDGCVQSWDIATGRRAGTCEGPATVVSGLRYRPDGQLLAWATNANAVEIWEVPSGKRLTPAGGHTAAIHALQFAPDGKTLVSCGQDGRILRWDPATGAELGPFELKETAARRRTYGYRRGMLGQGVFSPNGKYLIAPGANGVSSVWDVDGGLELFALTNPNGYVDMGGIIAFSGDSTRLVAMTRYSGRDQNLPIPVWDLETGLPLPPLRGQKGDFTCAALSTDAGIVVTAAYNYQPQGGQLAEAWAWDLTTGKVLSKVSAANTQISSVVFLDHRLYALFSYNSPGGIKVYDAVTGREMRTLEGPKGSNQTMGTALALSPDRRLLAFAPQGHEVYAKDGTSRPSGRRVVVWEVASGAVRHEFGGIEGNMTALAFSRDGKTLAGGSSDTTIYLWDLKPKADRADALSTTALDALWTTLDGPDGKKAEAALRTLAARPAEALPFLKGQVKPVAGVKPDPEKIRKLIADLDSPRYAVREKAMQDLERLGNHAREPVAEALKKPGLTPEVRERLEKLTDAVNKPDTGAEWVRSLRAVEALERIGTPDAVAHLKDLAAGGDAPPTRGAREALGRLGVK